MDGLQLETQPLVKRNIKLPGVIRHKKKKCTPKLKVVSGLLVVVLVIIAAVGATSRIAKTGHRWSQIEKIDPKFIPRQWQWDTPLDQTEKITLTLAIKQQNIESLESELLAVSDPRSETYGQHWSFDKVHEFLAPSDKSLNAIYKWLGRHGVHEEDITKLTPYGDFLEFETSIQTANRLLKTQFGYWTHSTTKTQHVRVKEHYFVPKEVSQYLDFVSPTLRFPLSPHTRLYQEIGAFDSVTDVINSDASVSYVLPSSLKSLYSVNEVRGGESDDNYQAVASFVGEWYNDDDLSQFWDFFSIAETTVERVPSAQPEGYGSEAELDVQYITAMGEQVSTLVWDIEDDLYFITLLKQIGSDSYPTPYVVSMSYGGDEPSVGFDYAMRANVEFGKIGLLGVTFLASSGDAGSLSSDDTCGQEDEYIATFPASSPYVTAVGGVTGGLQSDSSVDPSGYESAWTYSGGGFSGFFDQKSFQQAAISDYLENTDTLPDSSKYTSTGAGYPDLAAQSEYFVICDDGSYWAMSGTSCSCPTVAGMIALINDARLKAGKTSLGYLNPAIYGLYNDNTQSTYFNDVTEGNNLGCESDDYVGFYANDGWDPVTGLGTLQFDQLYDTLVNM